MQWKHKPGRYQPGNDGANKMRWFVHDIKIPSWRDNTKDGQHRRFASIHAAQRRADHLNAAPNPVEGQMNDEDKQKLKDLGERVEKLEDALKGLFSDVRQRSDDYHGVEWLARR